MSKKYHKCKVRKTKSEIIKEIQRLLLLNDYSVISVFRTTKFMNDNLETGIEACVRLVLERNSTYYDNGEWSKETLEAVKKYKNKHKM